MAAKERSTDDVFVSLMLTGRVKMYEELSGSSASFVGRTGDE